MSNRDVIALLTRRTPAGDSKTSAGPVARKRKARRIPSFFLVLTLKLPEMRFCVPIVIPMFVVEDLLESVAIAVRVFSFLAPSLKRKMERYTERYKSMFYWNNGEPDVTAVFDFVSELVRELRSFGRFTLLEVSDRSEGLTITLRLI